jgi:hypothetical protein
MSGRLCKQVIHIFHLFHSIHFRDYLKLDPWNHLILDQQKSEYDNDNIRDCLERMECERWSSVAAVLCFAINMMEEQTYANNKQSASPMPPQLYHGKQSTSKKVEGLICARKIRPCCVSPSPHRVRTRALSRSGKVACDAFHPKQPTRGSGTISTGEPSKI